MPELPEVETIKNGLGICLNATILESKVYNGSSSITASHFPL
jgi:formamidopyrimidine-DNA glycosylase